MRTTRSCTKCGLVQSTDQFTSSRPNECRTCRSAYHRAYGRKNREVLSAKLRERRQKVRETDPERDLVLREKKNAARRQGPYRARTDRACKLCAVALTPENNPPHCGRYCKTCRYKRVVARPEVQVALHAWQKAHRAERRAYLRAYMQAHPEKRSAYTQNYRARFGGARRNGVVTPAEWKARLEEFGHRCAYCLRGDVKLTQEHVEAVSCGGAHSIENVVPACQPCNSRKKDRRILLS
jgi:5-methylcytosine-specific restriction endonuclease McrA